MKVLIVYKSKTDFTKRYAEIIAGAAGAALMDAKDVTVERMSEYQIVVFGGGLYAGMINGLKQAKEMFEASEAKELVVFATGGTPNEAETVIEEMWKTNLSEEELSNVAHYYMQSGICYEKMKLPEKLLMKMMAAVMDKKKEKDESENGFAQAIKSSYDISSEVYAEPLIQYLKNRTEQKCEESI